MNKEKLDALEKIKEIIKENDSIEDSVKFNVQFSEAEKLEIVPYQKNLRLVVIDLINRVNENTGEYDSTDYKVCMLFDDPENKEKLKDSINLYRVFQIWLKSFHNNKAVHHEG